MVTRRTFLNVTVAGAVSAGLAGCSRAKPIANLEEMRGRAQTGELTIAYIPYDELTEDQGSGKPPTGFLPEACTMFLKAANVAQDRIIWRSVAWDTFGGLLASGAVDFSIAGTFITPARKKAVAFADPLFALGNGAVIRSDDARLLKVASVMDLDQPNLRIAVVSGEQSAEYANRNFRKASILVLDGPDLSAAPRAVEQGRVDAAMSDQYILRHFVDRKTGYIDVLEHHPFNVLPIAWAFPLGSQSLVQEVNPILGKLIASQEYRSLMSMPRYGEVPFITTSS